MALKIVAERIFLRNVSFCKEIGAIDMDNYALYSQSFKGLPIDRIKNIANPESFKSTQGKGGSKSYIYKWADLKITINQMLESEVEEHLRGFVGYVHHLSNSKKKTVDKRLTDRILKTTMVLSIIVEPKVDALGRAEDIIGAITYNTNSLMFFSDQIFDQDAKLIIGP
jgi:hypothetical protein